MVAFIIIIAILYSIKPSFQISASLGFLISSNNGKDYIYLFSQ